MACCEQGHRSLPSSIQLVECRRIDGRTCWSAHGWLSFSPFGGRFLVCLGRFCLGHQGKPLQDYRRAPVESAPMDYTRRQVMELIWSAALLTRAGEARAQNPSNADVAYG